jgi:GWxTD domain-containing protein
MNKIVWLFYCLAAFVFAAGAAGFDEGSLSLPRCSHEAPFFCADGAYFLADSVVQVEIYFTVCNEGLRFVKTDAGYRATADLSVVLLDGKSNQAAGDTYRIKLSAAEYAATTSMDSCTTAAMSFPARPGGYKMVLGLYDRDSRGKSTLEANLELPALGDRPSISDIEMLRPGHGIHTGLRQGFAPDVKRIYGEGFDSIYFYYEVYHGESPESLEVVEEVLDSNGLKALEQRRASAGQGTEAEVRAVPADSLANGRYVLRVAILGPDGKRAAARSKDFEVRREGFYSGKDVEQGIALLTYIATSSQIEAFEKARESERKKIWEDFWREKDPTPGTPRNELYEEHLRRFRYANDHFGVPLTLGWKTDRGRIYILYGEPDQIDSYPFEMGRKPTEVWHYYSRNRQFVFVDQTGFGDYELVGEGG